MHDLTLFVVSFVLGWITAIGYILINDAYERKRDYGTYTVQRRIYEQVQVPALFTDDERHNLEAVKEKVSKERNEHGYTND